MSLPAVLQAVLVVALPMSDALRTALDHYDFGEYAAACDQLEGLRAAGGLTPEEERLVLRRLGACHHILGELVAATAAFEALLDREPDATLDPVQFPPELVAFFREIKQRRAAATQTGEAPAETARAETTRPPTAEATGEAPAEAGKSRAVAFLPFGAGQFQNDQPGKGAVLASLEAVALGVGVVGLALFEAEKDSGTFLGGGTFEDEDKAASLQALYLGGFGTFAALWALGVVDALVYYDDPPAVSFVPTPGGLGLGGRF